jgi:hypothetical protein
MKTHYLISESNLVLMGTDQGLFRWTYNPHVFLPVADEALWLYRF